jgi:hypothetical protein
MCGNEEGYSGTSVATIELLPPLGLNGGREQEVTEQEVTG